MVALASEVVTRIERPFPIGQHRIGLTASVGIVERPAAAADAADLVKDADSALYRAKVEGPGRWAVYDAAQQATDSARMALTTSMRTALEAGEFTVVYQPIVALPGGELRGVEALLRWDHPTLGVLAPEAFIEPAESSGAHHPARPLGHGDRVRSGGAVVPGPPGRRPVHQRQPVPAAGPRSRLRRRCGPDHGRHRAAAGPAAAGADRERPGRSGQPPAGDTAEAVRDGGPHRRR